MSITDGFVKLIGVVLVIFGLVVLFATSFAALDLAFALHFVGGLVLIAVGVLLIKGGVLTL